MNFRLWFALLTLVATVVNSTPSTRSAVSIAPTPDMPTPGAPLHADTRPATTTITQTITADTTWTAANSPYEVANFVYVTKGVTLTVEPGVIVRFAKDTSLRVNGTLRAEGTPQAPILFTGTQPTPGWWDGIRIQGDTGAPISGSVFDYVTIEDGGTANLYLNQADVTVRHSTIRNATTPSEDAGHGIFGLYNTSFTLSDVAFSGNQGYAIYRTEASRAVQLARLAASGNGTDAIGMGSAAYSGNARWAAVGIPYVITAFQTVLPGASLIVEPGVTARFAPGTSLRINGRLAADGTQRQPIIFTATQPQPGAWEGIRVVRTTPLDAASATFSYATIEYGGSSSSSNLLVTNAQVALAHSIIRRSAQNGISISDGGSGSVIETSQIVENAGYGVLNREPSSTVLAANNWWGDAAGPTSDDTSIQQGCNLGSGAGGKISAGVAFKPFLASADTSAPSFNAPVLPADIRTLTLTPRRWFVPADGSSRASVAITLRDGNGRPLAGRTVRLQSTLGSVTDGGITDAGGQTFAYLTSSTPGDADMTASVQSVGACEFARSGSTRITFQNLSVPGSLLPNAEAPYVNSGIQVSPMPVTRGVPSTVSAHITNPNSFPISVDAEFGFVQSSIGLAFGPLGNVTGQIIAPHSTGVLAVPWTPPVGGHYCIELNYSYRAAGVGARAQASGGSGRSQLNLNAYQAPATPPGGKHALEEAEDTTGKFNSALGLVNGGATFGAVRQISGALGGDPPRLDYKTIAVPTQLTPAPSKEADITATPARAAAFDAFERAMRTAIANGTAAAVTIDRYGGASDANDLAWASLQMAALTYYQGTFGTALLDAADKLDAYRAVLNTEGVPDQVLTTTDVRAFQVRLRITGYTANEVAAMRALGWGDAEIEAEKQRVLAADPSEAPGSRNGYLTNVAAAYRILGRQLTTPANFGNNGNSTQRNASTQSQASNANELIRTYVVHDTFPVANPLAQAGIMEFRVRQLDMPPDWTISLDRTSIVLAPGEQSTLTVTITPGSAAAQASRPRVAVEGYINNQLIGGQVLEVFVPRYAFFDGQFRTYLPLSIDP